MRCRHALRCVVLSPLLLLAMPSGDGRGQGPFAPPRPPEWPPPLLYVRLDGPPGTRITFFRGGPPQTLPAPFVVGLRPGYIYRVQVSNPDRFPGEDLFPTLEVRGSLRVANNLRAADFPAALTFSDEDFRSVRAGALVTRVITLERPEVAIPFATRPEAPFEINVPSNRDPVQAASEHGRPLMLMRVGQRQMAAEELTALAISGTVLLPGETTLPLPRVPPWLGHACFPVLDPRVGPAPAHEDMVICDGGDVGLKAGLDPLGRLTGVDPSDTVAEYSDSQGRRRVAISNRVCLCVPRFLVVRAETTLAGQVGRAGPGVARTTAAQITLLTERPVFQDTRNFFLEGVSGGQRPSGAVNVEGPAVTGRIDGVVVHAADRTPGSVQTVCPPPTLAAPERPLVIIKWPDKCAGLVGDVITFYLKYTNHGGRPITDVAVTDSLGSRFEYVAGSARSDRESVFTTQPNAAGSVTLRWEFPGTLLPRQSGTVSFQARIR